MNDIDIERVLELMVEIPTVAAGSLGVSRQSKVAHNEALTDADIVIDDFLSRELTRVSSIPYVSEENYGDVAVKEGNPREFWLCDPLDGTVNSVVGIPYFSTAVSHVIDNRVDSAFVINLANRDCFHARRGAGIWRNGEAVRRMARCERQIFATGFAHDSALHVRQLRRMEFLLGYVDDFRRLASPCLDLCLVAEGVLSGSAEYLKAWDLAAGSLFLDEAGVRHNHSGRFELEKLNDQFYFVAAEDWLFPSIVPALEEIE